MKVVHNRFMDLDINTIVDDLLIGRMTYLDR